MIRIYLSFGWLRCRAVKWFPYDCGLEDFGYAEYRCVKWRWHKGDHGAYTGCI